MIDYVSKAISRCPTCGKVISNPNLKHEKNEVYITCPHCCDKLKLVVQLESELQLDVTEDMAGKPILMIQFDDGFAYEFGRFPEGYSHAADVYYDDYPVEPKSFGDFGKDFLTLDKVIFYVREDHLEQIEDMFKERKEMD